MSLCSTSRSGSCGDIGIARGRAARVRGATHRHQRAARCSDGRRDHRAPGGARGDRQRQRLRGRADARDRHARPRGLGRLRRRQDEGRRLQREPAAVRGRHLLRAGSGRVRAGRAEPDRSTRATTAQDGVWYTADFSGDGDVTAEAVVVDFTEPTTTASTSSSGCEAERLRRLRRRRARSCCCSAARATSGSRSRTPQAAGAVGAVIFNEGTIGAPDRNDVLIPTLAGYDATHPGGRHRLRDRPRAGRSGQRPAASRCA